MNTLRATEPRRVLITTSTFPVHPDDGIPRFIHDLAQSLSAHAQVTVLAPHAKGATRDERLDDVDVHRFSYFRPLRLQRLALGQGMLENLRGSLLAKVQIPSYLVRQATATRRLIRQKNIDVVNAHWLVPQGVTSAWACRGGIARLVLHVHAGDVYLLKRLRFGGAIARYVVSRSVAVLADGSHVRDTLDELLGFKSGAMLQPMGADTTKFGRNAASASTQGIAGDCRETFPQGFLLFVGRMSEKKGVIYLVRALPAVRERFPSVGLILIGDGPERSNVEREVRRLQLGDAVRFLGRRSHAEIVGYLHSCHVAVVPSIIDSYGETEGMPTVVVECLAAGVRVVGSAVDGIPDVLRHRENGWLCREKDPADLAEKIVSALEDPADSAIPRNAVATATDHEWGKVAERYMKHLERAVHKRA